MENRWARELLPLGVVLVGAAWLLALGNPYYLGLGTTVAAFAVAGMGLNLAFGYAGQPALGQQGFMGVGGYGFGWALREWGLSWPLALALSLILCVLVAASISLIVMRLSSHYFAIATLAVALIIQALVLRSEHLGGSAGMLLIDWLPLWFGDPTRFFILALALWAVTFAVSRALTRGQMRRVMLAIQDDPVSLSATGVNVGAYRMCVFAIAAALAGLAGFMLTAPVGVASPSLVSLPTAILLITVVVVGGLGTNFGPTLGAALLVLLPALTVSLAEYELLVYGVVFLLAMLFLPRGLAGLWERSGPLDSVTSSPGAAGTSETQSEVRSGV